MCEDPIGFLLNYLARHVYKFDKDLLFAIDLSVFCRKLFYVHFWRFTQRQNLIKDLSFQILVYFHFEFI